MIWQTLNKSIVEFSSQSYTTWFLFLNNDDNNTKIELGHECHHYYKIWNIKKKKSILHKIRHDNKIRIYGYLFESVLKLAEKIHFDWV